MVLSELCYLFVCVVGVQCFPPFRPWGGYGKKNSRAYITSQ